MFIRFMPKDGGAHRFDWEGVIIWLASNTSLTASNAVEVCPPAHGKWPCSRSFSLSGTHPLVKYFENGGSYSGGLTTTVGVFQLMVAWEDLTHAARYALNYADFGSGVVSFNDYHFVSNLGKATLV
jgi:hypothetical protein